MNEPSRARPRSLIASSLLVVIVAMGCTSNAPATSPGASGALSPLANSDWLLGTLFGRPIPSGTQITLLFSVLQAGGFSGCNQFSMPYATEDTGLRFGPISGTRASCGQALDAVETSYYTNLGLVTHWDITGRHAHPHVRNCREGVDLLAHGACVSRGSVDNHGG